MTKHYAHFNNEAKNAIIKALPSQKECVRVTVMQDLMSAQCPEWTLTIAQLVNAEQRGEVYLRSPCRRRFAAETALRSLTMSTAWANSVETPFFAGFARQATGDVRLADSYGA
jgi:lipopolysaccharide biosynthesis regulator YciM